MCSGYCSKTSLFKAFAEKSKSYRGFEHKASRGARYANPEDLDFYEKYVEFQTLRAGINQAKVYDDSVKRNGGYRYGDKNSNLPLGYIDLSLTNLSLGDSLDETDEQNFGKYGKPGKFTPPLKVIQSNEDLDSLEWLYKQMHPQRRRYASVPHGYIPKIDSSLLYDQEGGYQIFQGNQLSNPTQPEKNFLHRLNTGKYSLALDTMKESSPIPFLHKGPVKQSIQDYAKKVSADVNKVNVEKKEPKQSSGQKSYLAFMSEMPPLYLILGFAISFIVWFCTCGVYYAIVRKRINVVFIAMSFIFFQLAQIVVCLLLRT